MILSFKPWREELRQHLALFQDLDWGLLQAHSMVDLWNCDSNEFARREEACFQFEKVLFISAFILRKMNEAHGYAPWEPSGHDPNHDRCLPYTLQSRTLSLHLGKEYDPNDNSCLEVEKIGTSALRVVEAILHSKGVFWRRPPKDQLGFWLNSDRQPNNEGNSFWFVAIDQYSSLLRDFSQSPGTCHAN